MNVYYIIALKILEEKGLCIMKTAAIYARYSSDNQREESITAQLRICNEYCNKKGYVVIHQYYDEAYTGTNDRRPQFQQMISDAKSKLFTVAVFHKIDRNARNEYEYYFNKTKLTRLGISLEYATQPVDNSAEGQLMESMLVGMAAYYSRNLSNEVKKGLHENLYKGLTTGGIAPFGYNLINKHFMINESEAVAVRKMFEMYADGFTYSKILEWLNSNGYRTRRNRPFGTNSLHDMFCNQRYIGNCVCGKTIKNMDGSHNGHGDNPDKIVIENKCPAIITKDLFNIVAEKRKKNKRRTAAGKAQHEYLLSGLIYCECGATMSGTAAHGYTYYRCAAQARYRKSGSTCDNQSVRSDKIDNYLINYLRTLIFDHIRIEALIEKCRAAYMQLNKNQPDIKKDLLSKKRKLEKKLDKLYDLFEDSAADDFDRQRMQKIKLEIIAIDKKITTAKSMDNNNISTKQIMKYIELFKDKLKEESCAIRRTLISKCIEKVIIEKGKIKVYFAINFSSLYTIGDPPPDRTRQSEDPAIKHSG